MLIVTVYASVKPEMVDKFIAATKENVQNSIKEPGIIRFDFIAQNDEPANFLLIEVYKNEDAVAAHKETSHYNIWRNTVENMMSQTRRSVKYSNILPEDKDW